MKRYIKIKKYRKQIDKIHQKMIILIAERNRISKKIYRLKEKIDLPKIDIKREKEMVESAKKIAKRLKIKEKTVVKIMKILIRNNLDK